MPKILSNDLFREFNDEFKDIQSRRLPFSFDGEKITIGESKKPKRIRIFFSIYVMIFFYLLKINDGKFIKEKKELNLAH